VTIGSDSHKELFCETFIATHRVWEPRALPWPDLDAGTLERLRGLPFWGEALGTERDTGARILAYSGTVDDPLLREAIALQGREELRHAALLETLLDRYDIPVGPRRTAARPEPVERGFVDAGYGECIDSFFAFGLFEIARRSRQFSAPLLDLMEPILDEEARHIVFFANWEAHQQINRHRGVKALRAARALRYYLRAVRRRVGAIRNAQGSGFTASGARNIGGDLTASDFLQTCLRENARRLSAFDARLLRPRLVPALARVALRGLRRTAERG
jgi:hypothetical protein